MNGQKQQSQAAWDSFWKQNQDASGTVRTGCLPEAWQGIDLAQTAAWNNFAAKLPRGARVLDLGTGDGRVMAKLLARRHDLKPVGIDQATSLPPPPRGARMRPNVLMHDVPFPDSTFAAVTSQFGFEYGEFEPAAREVARVLRPGGLAGIMTHRADGPILAHNLRRRTQILWAIEEQQLAVRARNSLHLRQMGIATLPAEIASAPERGAELFGSASAAWEIAEAIRRTLLLSGREPPARTASVIDRIVEQARNELGRIASLEMASTAAGTGDKVEAALVAAGLTALDRIPLNDGNAQQPFATFLTLTLPR